MEKETFAGFFNDVKEHTRAWAETKVKIYQLKSIKILSRAAGNFAWLIITLFLLLLLFVFAGLTLGFWLSRYFDSYTTGFGIVSAFILVNIALLAIFKKTLFINPIIRKIIRESSDDPGDQETVQSK